MTADGRPATEAPPPPLHVVATAGHVDHGKSALILRLTDMDPDRLPEEKRRGLTIDLGFAWTTLPSGREVGFVDVPGHERFVRNMLAGVGPTRLVLFVVAADEGWRPQSEEHLQIVDVLGVHGGVVALTKADLVGSEAVEAMRQDLAGRLAGTRLAGAPVVACSAVSGEGLDLLVEALDRMLEAAPRPEETGRPRQFIDRVFTIRGAGTVVTGTLTGGPLAVGQEAEVLPSGHRARIRGLQTHKRSLEVARPVSRVAVNLAGTARTDLERGDVLVLPGGWRPTRTFEGWLRPVRGMERPLTARGAYKVHAGSAEWDATIRLYGRTALRPGDRAYVRVTLARPAVLDPGDAFVLREVGRQETVGGGVVLDVDPPLRPGPRPEERLRARDGAGRASLARLVVRERGAVRAGHVGALAGAPAADAVRLGAVEVDGWLVDPEALEDVERFLIGALDEFHARHPLRPGMDVGEVRAILAGHAEPLSDPALADAVMAHVARAGGIVREASVVRSPRHALSTVGREDADRLVAAVRDSEPAPPTVKELVARGFGLELVKAVCSEGRLVRLSADVVMTPEFVRRAEDVVKRLGAPPGVTVSAFREAVGTSRKYALPLLEYFDANGVTLRRGDVRLARR